MSRARRARRTATRAAYGGGALAATGLAGAAGYAALRLEAQAARRLISDRGGAGQEDDGVYGAGTGEPYRVLVLGDSTARGVGADRPDHTVGAIVATGLAALSGRPVRLVNVSVSGATSDALGAQLAAGLAALPGPQVGLVTVGANDITHRLSRADSVRHLTQCVRELRDAGAEVVVGTCPDLGTVRPIPQPLRTLARRWSRDLAAAQTVAAVGAGARTVSIGDLVSPLFYTDTTLFSEDRFHPSSAGYARAAAALLPSVCDAVGLSSVDTGRPPDPRRGEHVEPLADAAERAVLDPGSEVSGVDVDGRSHGVRGQWGRLLRRARLPLPGSPPGDADDSPRPPHVAPEPGSDPSQGARSLAR